jgi:hypothetical protein
MRLYRISFVCGLATGYVLGARGGREQYDRIAKLGRQAAGHPAVQQAAGMVQAQATRLARAGADTAKAQLRARTAKLTQSRPSRARSGRTNARRHEPGGNGSAAADGHPAGALNGSHHRQH